MTWNLVALFLAISGTWTYPRRYTGAFVLGNFLMAILMRNELFGRFLYLFVNTFFAKVGSALSCSLSSVLKMTSSGLRWSSVWHAHPCYSISVEYIRDVRLLASSGYSSNWPLSRLNTGNFLNLL